MRQTFVNEFEQLENAVARSPCPPSLSPTSLSPVRHLFLLPIFLGHCFRLIPAPGSFASSAFSVPLQTPWVPPRMQPLALGAEALAFGCPKKMGQKKEKMSYLNSVTLVGFVGVDPEQRQAKSNGTKFTVFPSPRNARGKTRKTNAPRKPSGTASVCFVRNSQSVLPQPSRRALTSSLKASSSGSTYERPNGKSKKSATTKITSWSIRANVVCKLDRGEPEPEVFVSGSVPSEHSPQASDEAPF